jgi:hypothetical protein
MQASLIPHRGAGHVLGSQCSCSYMFFVLSSNIDVQVVSIHIEGTSTVEITLAQYWSTQGHTALDVQVTWRYVLISYLLQ